MKNINGMPRKGCKEIWNAFMVKKASFDARSDFPKCISTEITPPSLIAYDDAKTVYKKEVGKQNKDFYVDSFIHFYIDDYKFDGKRTSIWTFPSNALKIIRHFAGIITPDFSTYADFPDPIKRYNTYRMFAYGCWMNSLNIPVINNVRWGTYETWSYCFSGIPIGSTVAIGSVASGIRRLSSRPIFDEGLREMVSVVHPKKIIVYGSANYPLLHNLSDGGIEIISYPSKKSLAYKEVIK